MTIFERYYAKCEENKKHKERIKERRLQRAIIRGREKQKMYKAIEERWKANGKTV